MRGKKSEMMRKLEKLEVTGVGDTYGNGYEPTYGFNADNWETEGDIYAQVDRLTRSQSIGDILTSRRQVGRN